MSLALVTAIPATPVLPAAPRLTPQACLEAIRLGDPMAAQHLYRMYADQIRSYLRRHTGIQAVEDTVFSVLIEAIRAIREPESSSIDDLSQTVRELSQQSVFALRRASTRRKPAAKETSSPDSGRDLVNGLFTSLDCREREVLLRSLLLSERDNEISTDTDLPILRIRRAHAKARLLFRMSEYPDAIPA